MTVLAMAARRGFFADGAWFLVHILETRDFFVSNDPTRLFMYWFTQFPTVLAIRLGVPTFLS